MQQNRNQIFEIYLDDFSSFKKVKELKNPNFIATDEVINESLQQTKSRFVKEIPNIILNEEEKQFVINKIKSIYSIYQEEGDVILGDYEHDYDWYKNFLESDDCQTYHWDRYKNHLTVAKHFPKEVIKVLEEKTLFSLMSYLGNPKDDSAFSVRGLVVGDVQSGKTSNYLGLVTKAADAGYKVIFILTGTIESLRKQTQQRVEEGFIGWDSFNGVAVGVGRGDPTPKAFTSRGKDFVMKYIDEASKINEEDIQDIWVKLLVQENKSSGSISKRTLDIVKNLYPAEAKLFESIAKYSLSNGTIHDCFCNKFSFIDISKLQDIGLMKSSDTIEQTITIDGNNPVPFCRIEGNTIFIIKNTSNTIEKISYKCHLLTNEGVELKSALGISIDKNDYLDYCRQIKQAKNQKNLMCSAHKINYFSSGQVNYEINDIL